MATNQPYTLQDIQDRINTLVSNDSDTPVDTDDEWSTRLNLINQAIGKWEMADTLWDELWTTYTHASTVALGDTTYSLDASAYMRFPGGYVNLVKDGVTSKYEIVSPEQFQTYGGSTRVVYFTGNNLSGWVLNLGWTPTVDDGSVGATITFPYYKYATRYTSASDASDTTEMSNPNFIVYDVAATKSLMEAKNNQFSVYSTEAQAMLDQMKVVNEMKPHYQNNMMEDSDALTFGAVMGE